jgi:uncharacterized protein
MAILDFHLHVGAEEHLNPRLVTFLRKQLGDEVLGFINTITTETLLGFLDNQGVDRAVLLAEATPHVVGIVPNGYVADLCKGTDRLIPFGSVNLESDIPVGEQTEHLVKELGCKGLKLLPPSGYFYPDDPRILPAYEVASDLGIPVMFHTGTSVFPGTRIKYANPLLLDDVAQDFPDLNIIICHGGRPFWYAEAQWMLIRHPNTYVEVSGIPARKLTELFPKMEHMADRFIFGTDWPQVPSLAHQVERIRNLPLSKEAVEAILWGNGAKLLNLDRPE